MRAVCSGPMPVQSPGMIAMMGFVMGVRFRGLGQRAGPQGIAASENRRFDGKR
jgi:hypothetical protein